MPPNLRHRFLPFLLLLLLAGQGCSILREPEGGELVFSLSFDRDTFLDTTLLRISLLNLQNGKVEEEVLLTEIEPGRLPHAFSAGRNRMLKIEAFGLLYAEGTTFLSRWGLGFSPPLDLLPGRPILLPDPICVYRTVLLAGNSVVTDPILDIEGFLEPSSPLFLEREALTAITLSAGGIEDPSSAPFTNYAFRTELTHATERFRLFARNAFGAPLPATLFLVRLLPRPARPPVEGTPRVRLSLSIPLDVHTPSRP